MMGLRGESMNPMTFGNMIHPTALDDDFFAVFFNIFNFLILGLGITIVRLMTGEFQHRIEFEYWSGIEIVDDNKYST